MACGTLKANKDSYIKTAGIGADQKGPLFRSAISKNGALSGDPRYTAVCPRRIAP